MGRAEEYDGTQRSDVRRAFSVAFLEIKDFQERLRKVRPESSLLNLVTLRDCENVSQRGMDFHKSYGSIVREHSDYPQGATLYYGLGVYVDLLEEEIKSPKFSRKAG